MTKELDYLDKILNYQPLTLVERTIIECIKEKIQRLEAIDNANPSEAFEWLEKFKGIEISALPFKDDCGTKEVDLNEVRFVGSQLNNDFRKFVYIIENALLKAQEQEKVIRLIMEKDVDIVSLKQVLSVKQYNSFISFRINYMEYMNLT